MLLEELATVEHRARKAPGDEELRARLVDVRGDLNDRRAMDPVVRGHMALCEVCLDRHVAEVAHLDESGAVAVLTCEEPDRDVERAGEVPIEALTVPEKGAEEVGR